jgi:hypothetical protein
LVEGSMSNRDLGIAAVAVVVLLGMLMAGGWYYRDDEPRPLEHVAAADVAAAALTRGSGPIPLSVPQPWTAGDAESEAVLRDLARMLREAEVTSFGPRVVPQFFQPEVLQIWLKDGMRVTVAPALDCAYTLASETCSWTEDEILVTAPASPVPMTMKSAEMKAWLIEGWQDHARMVSPEDAQETLERLGY